MPNYRKSLLCISMSFTYLIKATIMGLTILQNPNNDQKIFLYSDFHSCSDTKNSEQVQSFIKNIEKEKVNTGVLIEYPTCNSEEELFNEDDKRQFFSQLKALADLNNLTLNRLDDRKIIFYVLLHLQLLINLSTNSIDSIKDESILGPEHLRKIMQVGITIFNLLQEEAGFILDSINLNSSTEKLVQELSKFKSGVCDIIEGLTLLEAFLQVLSEETNEKNNNCESYIYLLFEEKFNIRNITENIRNKVINTLNDVDKETMKYFAILSYDNNIDSNFIRDSSFNLASEISHTYFSGLPYCLIKAIKMNQYKFSVLDLHFLYKILLLNANELNKVLIFAGSIHHRYLSSILNALDYKVVYQSNYLNNNWHVLEVNSGKDILIEDMVDMMKDETHLDQYKYLEPYEIDMISLTKQELNQKLIELQST